VATAVVMPKQGNTVESCVILSWKKKPGDTVAQGEPLCEVETDKAVFEVPSPSAGTLLECFFPAGADVAVLTNIAAIGAVGESAAALRPGAAPQAAAAPAAAEAPRQQPAAAAAPAGPRAGRLRVSPRARRLAAERGIDPATLAGSGPGGRIIVRDVPAAASPQRAASPAAGAAPAEPVRGVRKLIAERMRASLATTAQLTMNASADARRLLELRRRLKASEASPAEYGLGGVTINDLVLFAAARVLRRFPDLNALYENGAITRSASVHLGFAVDTERGLMVPVIRDAHGLSLRALSERARALAESCVKGSVNPDDLAGGTFTVTNLGNLGVESFTPVLNVPQVAILGVGAITLRPVREGDQVVFIDSLGLSLTIDHQVVDGAPGARFLKAFAQAIAEIDLQLAL
jgi:pyruvate dehydrogenase E2 component (dihydrolipoamide acetyltransferase)